MLFALAEDLAAVDGLRVAALRDARLAPLQIGGVREIPVDTPEQAWMEYDRQAASADWTIVIAPEFGRHLLRRCRRVLAAGGRLLGPEPPLVELASDKHRLAKQLAAGGVPVAQGRLLTRGDPLPSDFPYPAVLKPRHGAGSLGLVLVGSAEESVCYDPSESHWRLERFCPGTAVSVAFLCGPARQVPLPPCRQHLSDDGRFAYLGGSLPLPAPLASRATRLAYGAMAALQGCRALRAAANPETQGARDGEAAVPASSRPLFEPTGYLGIDLVLGEDPTGRDDVVIEINPRLTTSYVGLRRVARVNLASALLAIREGGDVELSFSAEPVQFEPGGKVYLRSALI